jgi:hypothetical protein
LTPQPPPLLLLLSRTGAAIRCTARGPLPSPLPISHAFLVRRDDRWGNLTRVHNFWTCAVAACGLRSLRYELGRSICMSSAERAVMVYTVQYVGRFHGDLPRRDTCAFYSITNGASSTGLHCTVQLKAAARALQSAFPRDHNQSADHSRIFRFYPCFASSFSVINPTGQHPGEGAAGLLSMAGHQIHHTTRC